MNFEKLQEKCNTRHGLKYSRREINRCKIMKADWGNRRMNKCEDKCIGTAKIRGLVKSSWSLTK